eukprot:1451145-Rhodomonas_salina.2
MVYVSTGQHVARALANRVGAYRASRWDYCRHVRPSRYHSLVPPYARLSTTHPVPSSYHRTLAQYRASSRNYATSVPGTA